MSDSVLLRDGSLPLTGLVAAALAVATLRYGPLAVIPLVALVGLALAVHREQLTVWVLPLCLLPHGVQAGGLYVSASDALVWLLGAALLLDRATGRHDRPVLGELAYPALAFVAWTAASALWAADPIAPLVEATQRFAFVILGTALAASLPPDGGLLRRSLRLLVTGSAALATITLITGLVQGQLVGVYAAGMHKNTIGYLLSYGVVTGVALRWYGRCAPPRWLALATALATAGLIVSGSRGGWVGALVALGLMAVLRHPALGWPVASASVVVVVLVLLIVPLGELGELVQVGEAHSTASVRIQTWTQGLQTAAAHPLLGVGAGNFTAAIRSQGSQVDPNNLVLLAAAETGVPGAVLLLALFGTSVGLAARTLRSASATTEARLAAVAGIGIVTAAFAHAQFDMFWTRGIGLATFLGAGLTLWGQKQSKWTTHSLRLPHRQPTT